MLHGAGVIDVVSNSSSAPVGARREFSLVRRSVDSGADARAELWGRHEGLGRDVNGGLQWCESVVWAAEKALKSKSPGSAASPRSHGAVNGRSPRAASQKHSRLRECVRTTSEGLGRGGGVFHGSPAWFASVVDVNGSGRGLRRQPLGGHPRYSRLAPAARDCYLLRPSAGGEGRRSRSQGGGGGGYAGGGGAASPLIPQTRSPAAVASVSAGEAVSPEPVVMRQEGADAPARSGSRGRAPSPQALMHERPWNSSTYVDHHPRKAVDVARPPPLYAKGGREKSAIYFRKPECNFGRYTREEEEYLAMHRQLANEGIVPTKRAFKAELHYQEIVAAGGIQQAQRPADAALARQLTDDTHANTSATSLPTSEPVVTFAPEVTPPAPAFATPIDPTSPTPAPQPPSKPPTKFVTLSPTPVNTDRMRALELEPAAAFRPDRAPGMSSLKPAARC